ncbi:MAG TPA: addiction module protein [Thermoanaerobaculia bacterium]|nr:addiction module protein [Thermoanaerobaculia bacterium]
MATTTLAEPPGFAELTKDEQIRYLQALWERISDNPAEVPVSEEQLQLAQERWAACRAQPARSRSAFAVIDRLAQKKS